MHAPSRYAALSLIAVLCPAIEVAAQVQHYRVETDTLLVVSGNVKAGSCKWRCSEGHDCSTCVGVRAFDENGNYRTAVYDKVQCCDDCGEYDFRFSPKCGFPGEHCPANTCPSNSGKFSVSVAGMLPQCVAQGVSFYVPRFTAVLGNLSNNTPTCGSACNAADFFQPYRSFLQTQANWGGFNDTCPNPSHPDIVCIPISCSEGPRLLAPHPFEPSGPVIAGDEPGVLFAWSSAPWDDEPPDPPEALEYRVVVNGTSGVVVDARVPGSACTNSRCTAGFELPEAGTYTWWVEARSTSYTSAASKSLVFYLSVVETCAGRGGHCAAPTPPPSGPLQCEPGDTDLGPTFDCERCCQPTDEPLTCTQMGGPRAECSDTPCPPGRSLGPSSDCADCCTPCTSTGCPAGSCGAQVDNCGRSVWCGECLPTCGAMGGDHCSQGALCPGGYTWLGRSSDCAACCKKGPSCGVMGGNYCSPNDWCPQGQTFLGVTWDCAACCSSCVSTGCPAGSCGAQTDNCGRSIWCGDCLPTCGAMGGDHCSQSGACPAGYNSLGTSSDCHPCCKKQAVDGYCGDGACNAGETSGSCCGDCGCPSGQHCNGTACVPDPFCGDGACNGGEDSYSCCTDCGCGAGTRCEANTCTTYCGNGTCDGNEHCASCQQDCGCSTYQQCRCALGNCDIGASCEDY